jgi:hypothetical protein
MAKHFLGPIPALREILHRELGMRESSRRWVPHSLSSAQNVARVEASSEMLEIFQESETNYFDGIATAHGSSFQDIYSSSKILVRSRSDVVPRTKQGLGTKKL